MFSIDLTVKLTDTDAAGIVFYGNYFRLAHEAYESFMDKIGFGLDRIIHGSDLLIVISRAESHYKTSLKIGQKYTISIRVEKIGNTSYVLAYEFTRDGETTALLKTVHVAIEKASGKKIRLPDRLRDELDKYR